MAEENSNYLVRLYKGDISLVTTFWGYYTGVGIIFQFIIIFTSVILFSIYQSEHELPIVLIVLMGLQLVVLFIYYPFISIALYRSAKKYQGLALWRILAQVTAVLTIGNVGVAIVLLVLPFLGIDIIDLSSLDDIDSL